VTPNNKQPAVQVEGIAKRYGAVQALNPTSFSVPSGSYFVLLGPSGGGKTTTLRLIGGLVEPTEGKVLINGTDVTRQPANERDTTMVFQSYALFPHMSVAENVAYGLTLKKLPRNEIDTQVSEMLELVGLGGYESRMPHELSGGQQQRVQLGRSLILKSSVLLLDEPLAALDASLRKSMCIELKRLQESVGITFIHVTHNQEEAMTIADEIALIADGDLVESGSVKQIYETPKRRFTAEFIGESTILDGVVTTADASITVDTGFATIQLPQSEVTTNVESGDSVSLSLRSESATLAHPEKTRSGTTLRGVYRGGVYLGFYTNHLVALPNGIEMTVRMIHEKTSSDAPDLAIGDDVEIQFAPKDVRLHLN